ncbi:cytochrome P450 4C1-like isoform X3 [Temnothorax nylanderi]|uniref:cytochrome P450 4C1-like isoform X3 n=1 Tax=Temnothorax nylanderi TaxID=102681 RepID=UPI003A894126
MITIILLSFILILLMYNYYVHHGKNGRLINLIPGPPGRLILGNILDIVVSREELWKLQNTLLNQYYPIYKIWAFFIPTVVIQHPDDLETILSNTKHIEKSLLYDILHPWLGTSLLTSAGAKWHPRRKILTPTFHFNILQQFVEILIEEGESMTKSLKNTGGTVVKDLVPFFSEHTLNAICETAMGTSLRGLGAFQQRYIEAVHRMGELVTYRAMRQWLFVNWIFSLTPKGREQKKVLKVLHGFTERIIAERKLYHDRTNNQYLKSFGNDTSAERDDAEPIGLRRKRLAMLDLLIAASREGLMTDLDVREEVDVFMFGGHDTTAMGLCFIFALLAEHKDIQDRVRNEVDTALQKNGKKFTMKLLQDLPYLERCIKEALRLYPSIFVISRIPGEDVKLQSYLVPAGTLLLLNIYAVHRDPNFWPNPEVFDPDRFLSEKIRNRHPYSYVPFSAGPRNCIGYGPRIRGIKRGIMADTRFTIAKLNNTNFHVWKCNVELLLIKEDLWHTISEARPTQPDERWLKADRQARATIGLLVEDDQLRYIRDTNSAKEAWTALQSYHQKASLTNQVFLFKKICSIKLSENGDMESHLNAMLNSVDQLTALGEALKDKMVIAMLLCSLPESYNTLITALETRSEDELTIELVKGKLLDEDRRRKNARGQEDERDDRALKTQSKKFTKATSEKHVQSQNNSERTWYIDSGATIVI